MTITQTIFVSPEAAAAAVGGDAHEIEVRGAEKTCRNPFTNEVCVTGFTPGATTYFEQNSATRIAAEQEIASASTYEVPTETGYKIIEPVFDMNTGQHIGWSVS